MIRVSCVANAPRQRLGGAARFKSQKTKNSSNACARTLRQAEVERDCGSVFWNLDFSLRGRGHQSSWTSVKRPLGLLGFLGSGNAAEAAFALLNSEFFGNAE